MELVVLITCSLTFGLGILILTLAWLEHKVDSKEEEY